MRTSNENYARSAGSRGNIKVKSKTYGRKEPEKSRVEKSRIRNKNNSTTKRVRRKCDKKNRRRNKRRTKIKIMQIDICHLEKKNAKKVKTRK